MGALRSLVTAFFSFVPLRIDSSSKPRSSFVFDDFEVEKFGSGGAGAGGGGGGQDILSLRQNSVYSLNSFHLRIYTDERGRENE